MKLLKKEARIIKNAIQQWQKEEIISVAEAEKLNASYQIIPFDWRRVAKYAFWLSIFCIVISISAALADEWLFELLKNLFQAPAIIKCLFFIIVATALYAFGIQRKHRAKEKIYSNESIFFLGVIATAIAISFLGQAIGSDSESFSRLLLLATIVYGVLGLWFPSKLIWLFSLFSLGSWFGAETGYISSWGAYYLGMNYPMRFVLFGLVLTLIGEFLFTQWQTKYDFLRPTRAVGLLYFFIALWIMSIFGNYGDLDSWNKVKQIELFHWSLLFGMASVVSIFHGVKYDDGMTRGLGLTFLLINLYTRLFECFWDNTHKAIFFALLGASFWLLGSKAETIWQLGMKKS